MERIQGENLAYVWHSLSEESRAKILEQLKNLIREIRSLAKPESFGVANVDGGSLYDGRVQGGSRRFGPFQTVQEFQKFIRGGVAREPGHIPEIDKMMEQQDGA
jgi:hypothetical protein